MFKNDLTELRNMFNIRAKNALKFKKIKQFIKENNCFDIIHSLKETCWLLYKDYEIISKKWNDDEEMTNPNFVYTAIIFYDIVEKIKEFLILIQLKPKNEQIKKNSLININFKNLIFESLSSTFSKKNEINKNMKWENLFSILGINKKLLNNESDEENSLTLLNTIRNKLVHPNSKKSNIIHMFYDDSKKYFKFGYTFTSKKGFIVKKDIFIKAIKILIKWCDSQMEIWNKLIDKLFIKKIPKHITQEHIKKILLKHEYSNVPKPIKDENFFNSTNLFNRMNDSESDLLEKANLFKVAQLIKNEYMQKFLIDNIWLDEYFYYFGNYNLEKKSFMHNIDLILWDPFVNYIRSILKKWEKDSAGDLSVQIGPSTNKQFEQLFLEFPDICKKINKDIPGDGPYAMRIYSIIAPKLNWEFNYKKQKSFINEIKKLKTSELTSYLDNLEEFEVNTFKMS